MIRKLFAALPSSSLFLKFWFHFSLNCRSLHGQQHSDRCFEERRVWCRAHPSWTSHQQVMHAFIVAELLLGGRICKQSQRGSSSWNYTKQWAGLLLFTEAAYFSIRPVRKQDFVGFGLYVFLEKIDFFFFFFSKVLALQVTSIEYAFLVQQIWTLSHITQASVFLHSS